MPPTWKNIVADVAFAVLLLVVTNLLTNFAPIPNRFWRDGDDFRGPIAEQEPIEEMAVYMWVVPGVLLGLLTIVILRDIRRTLYVVFTWVQANILSIFVTGLFRYF